MHRGEEAVIIPYQGITPRVDASVFVAEGAKIIGDVEIGKESSVWFNTVIRGDVHFIRIGERTNIQDSCVLHVSHRTHPLVIGSDVTIGHGSILHGAKIGNSCLIGLGAKVLDGADIGDFAFVAAGSLVLEGFHVPAGTLVAGIPARVKRDLTEAERMKIVQSARNYMDYVKTYR
ncbi:MAG: gamma carbonic anhydrase family protein [Ignavibacteria bacterium]|nr:gamma carbonic anhydrase family protein [Ignavibacteria bacterium]